MSKQPARAKVYDGDGDHLMAKDRAELGDRITLVPDSLPSKVPDTSPRIRIMWGQHLLEDLLVGRYASLVCAVNGTDNSRGIISQLAALLPTSQWDEKSITAYASHFSAKGGKVKVLKYDMDMVEVLGILRPPDAPNLTIQHLSSAFKIVSDMISHNPRRLPSASVSFLGARANALVDSDGKEPSFEAVLRAMHIAGYTGDIFPPTSFWTVRDVGLYTRYPFAPALDRMRSGGF